MYKILQSVDWSFLVDLEVEQVAVGLYQVQVHFSKDVSVSIQSDFVHGAKGKLHSDASDLHLKAASLVHLLGRRVTRVQAHGEENLTLHFDDGQTLVILVDNEEPYEAFTVNRPGETIIV